jgi:hypothetical protein
LKKINVWGLHKLYKAASFFEMKELRENVLMMLENAMMIGSDIDYFEKKGKLWGVNWQFDYHSLETFMHDEEI